MDATGSNNRMSFVGTHDANIRMSHDLEIVWNTVVIGGLLIEILVVVWVTFRS